MNNLNLQIYEEATEWVVKHREGGLALQEKKTFDEWLRASPQHVRAYLEMSSIWEDVPSLKKEWNPDTEELVARARADVGVVPHPQFVAQRTGAGRSVPSASSSGGRSLVQKARLLAFAASVLLMLSAVGTWLYTQRNVYTTAIGEQRSLALSDGSTVELNSQSRIKVRYENDERRIDLVQGQALFRVAKDANRPFVVDSGDTRVRAVGTQFDVNRRKAGTVVTVIEGRVAVESEKSPLGSVPVPDTVPVPRKKEKQKPAGVLLSAGEQIRLSEVEISKIELANIGTATAWTRRSLVFEASPLTDVADEFNRYNTRRLVVETPELASFHVSGVFSSVEPGLLLSFLRAQPELVVEETDSEIRIRKR